MKTYYVVETNEFNMANKDSHERFVCCDEFMARSILNMIISVEFDGCYDKKKHMETDTDETFIDGWWFYSKTQHYSEGDWITLRKHEIDE